MPLKLKEKRTVMRIEAENLTYIYNKGEADELKALDNISFTLEQGEYLGIIGHTGSGKSTLVQHMNGLLKPHSGRLLADNTDISESSREALSLRRRIGLVFQYPEYQLFEETVAADIAFGPKNLGLSEEEIKKRVEAAMELAKLDYGEFADKSPFELSGGQKRSAAIAGVLAMEPDVLILDEPAAGLDPSSHDSIMELLADIRSSRGTTIVLVTHDMDDAAEFCERLLVLEDGRLTLDGTAAEVFSNVEQLVSSGLELPSGVRLMRSLRDRGVEINAWSSALTAEGAAGAVCELLRRGKGYNRKDYNLK